MTNPQRAAVLGVLSCLVTDAPETRAACNLIPAAERTFPSNLGAVDGPLAAPGGEVEIRLHPDCDALSPGFDVLAAQNNVVTITFEPPDGAPTTDVLVDAAAVTVLDPRTLRFVMPDTTGVHPPHGLAGPARVRIVHAASDELLAEIRDLYQPTAGCDRFAEAVFQRFTVLPPPNVMADLVAETATIVRATLDGGDNLLVPFDHVAVLPEGPGAPVARLLGGMSTIEAFSGGGVPVTIPSQDFVRAFTLDGRPLPPLLRVGDGGTGLFGTADAATSVLRIARTNGGPPIYDFTDRLDGGIGPIVIDKNVDGFTITSRDPVPLETLQSSAAVVAFARDETKEGDLNGDGDAFDRVVQILDVATGASVDTGKAVATVADGPLQAPALVTGGNLTAFLESEAGQGQTDLDGDGGTDDVILRVFDGLGTELTAGFDVAAAVDRIIDGRELGIAGDLVLFRTPRPGVAAAGNARSSVGTGDVRDLTIAGDFIYAVSLAGTIRVLRLRPDGADVDLLQVLTDGMGGVDGLNGARAVAVSPDGAHVYAASGNQFSCALGFDNAVAAFARDPVSGLLTFVEAKFDGVDGVTGLTGARDVAVSPDGAHVYVATACGDKVVTFARDPGTGVLAFVGAFGTASSFDGVAASPDGAHVYAISSTDDAVNAFARDAGTGALALVGVVQDGVGGVDGLQNVESIALSPGGEHLYAGGGESKLAVFERDGGTGALGFVEAMALPASVDTLLPSADGRQLWGSLSSGSPPPMVTFTRDSGSGTLMLVDATPAGGVSSLALTADGRYLVGGVPQSLSQSLLWYRTDAAELRVFEAATQSFRAAAEVDARDARLAADHALVLSPNSEFPPAEEWRLYDLATDTLSSICSLGLNRGAVAVALSDAVVAWTAQEGSAVNDVNEDGDEKDRVVLTHTIGTLPSSPLWCNRLPGAPAAEAVSVYDETVVITTLEDSEGMTDLNDDGDATDLVLRLHVPGVPGTTTNLAAAEEFVRGGRLVAFRTSEAAEGNTDLNGDGDTLDAAMRVLDLDTSVIHETGLAAIPCEIGGCDPFVPYKVTGDVVAFLTREQDQGSTDLNGDGDAVDTVLHLFNVVGETLEIFDLGDGCGGATQFPRFPEVLVDGAIQYVELSESERGEDLNGDGDTDDCVVFVVGDQDGDGTTDGGDTCVEAPNADQADGDTDVLGDVCDPSAQLPVDAVALYGAKESAGTAKLARFGPIVLGDRFGLLHDQVAKLKGLARPAVVNDVVVGDPDTSLVAYAVKRAAGPRFAKTKGVRVRNACHDMLVEVLKPETLLVPARTSLVGPVAPPVPGTHGVDHHQCYKVKVQSKLSYGTPLPKFAKGRQVTLDDELHPDPLRYDLLKPTRLCVPVAKAVDPASPPAVLAGPAAGTPVVIEPAAITSPAQSLVCYKAKRATSVIPQEADGCEPLENAIPMSLAQPKLAAVEAIHTADQFGSLQVDAKKLVEICLPATTEVGGLPEAPVP